MRLRNYLAALALLATAACAGTPGTQSPLDSASAKIATRLGVQVAILRYVGEDPSRAKRVKDATTLIEIFVGGEAQTMAQVRELTYSLIDRVACKQGQTGGCLTPIEVLAVRQAADLAGRDIDRILPGGMLDQDARERIVFYLDAVQEAMDLVAVEG